MQRMQKVTFNCKVSPIWGICIWADSYSCGLDRCKSLQLSRPYQITQEWRHYILLVSLSML